MNSRITILLIAVLLIVPLAGTALAVQPDMPSSGEYSQKVASANQWAGNAGSISMPLAVINEQAVQVAAGREHTCALTEDGGVKCWGSNSNGQLGDGTTVDHLTPMEVTGLGAGITAIAAGWNHTCALTEAGGVKCWGWNSDGQIGDGTAFVDRLMPVDVVGLDSGIQAIAAGRLHTCALTENSGIKCWGSNSYGQLGDGATTGRREPTDVAGLGSGIKAIGAGFYHTCAVTQSGAVKCWGQNNNGQLGDGATTDRSTPVDVSGLSSGGMDLAIGWAHTCATIQGGGAKCWGLNSSGQVGDGTRIRQRLTPVDVINLDGELNSINGGYTHTCALTAEGGVKCWGANFHGQVGEGTTWSTSRPRDVIGLTSGVRALAAGEHHTCAVSSDGGVKCWGANWLG